MKKLIIIFLKNIIMFGSIFILGLTFIFKWLPGVSWFRYQIESLGIWSIQRNE